MNARTIAYQGRRAGLLRRAGCSRRTPAMAALFLISSLPLALAAPAPLRAQVVVRGKVVHTLAGAPLENGVVVITGGKIAAVGKAGEVAIPPDHEVLEAAVVTPGLIDAHGTAGLSGLLNVPHDQDQTEHSAPIQPELRALDAYNPQEELVAWIRSFGVTTLHVCPAPTELVAGQTMVVKTDGVSVDKAVVAPARALAVSLAEDARKGGSGSPGTRGKAVSMLREQFIRAREHQRKLDAHEAERKTKKPPPEAPARDLKLEALAAALRGELTLLVTAHRAQDIVSALRLAKEFDLKIWLDGAAEAHLLVDEIKASGAAVLPHPSMARASGELENASFTLPAKLRRAGVPIAFQSGYEAYVPKTRVVLFEAAIPLAHGLSFDDALAAITRDAAKILGVADRVGSLEVGKDGDVALYDGDPFEFTSHCVGVVIEGRVVSRQAR